MCSTVCSAFDNKKISNDSGKVSLRFYHILTHQPKGLFPKTSERMGGIEFVEYVLRFTNFLPFQGDEKAYVKRGAKRVHVSRSGMVVSDGFCTTSMDHYGRIVSAS